MSDKLKAKLVEMAKACINSTIEEVLYRHRELSLIYKTKKREDLLLKVGLTDSLVHEVVRRRLSGDPEPWLTADECIEFLSDLELDIGSLKDMAEIDGKITAIRQMMLEMDMKDDQAALGEWLYG